MINDKLKILVVDDTVTYRQILSRIIADIEGVELVGTAYNGKTALTKIELKQPDLVLLDVFMPEMDGLEALEQIKKKYPHIDVIMISGVDKETATYTLKALEAGALDFIPKSRGISPENNLIELKTELSRLIQMARTRKYSRQARGYTPFEKKAVPSPLHPVPIIQHPASGIQPPSVIKQDSEISHPTSHFSLLTSHFSCRIDVVAIGVSTGGPNALQEMVPKLDKNFPVPILAVQHMPPMFTASLAERLDNLSSITVVEGRDGQTVESGIMYIAPGGRHMVTRKGSYGKIAIGLTDSPPVNSCRPSVDVLFRSLAMTYGGNVLTVVLTGMGSDGVSGVAAIRRKGGYSIVQDEKTSLIWGMPGSVVSANQADAVVSIDMMALKIMEIVKKGCLHVEN